MLNLATESNSPAHSSIGTPSSFRRRTPTACRHTVSDSISLPFRGAFHLSLTVLVHYRSSRVFSLGKWSPLLPTGFRVSRGTQDHRGKPTTFSSTGLSPALAALSRDLPLTCRLVTSSEHCSIRSRVLQHLRSIGLQATKLRRFGLLPVRSPLLGEYFLFLGVLRCFSSPGSLVRAYVFSPP